MASEPESCVVNEAIRDALRDGAFSYEARRIRVEARLDATYRVVTEERVLRQAVYTIFRGLAHRLEPGATLKVVTNDRAGGDVELRWEAKEMASPSASDPLWGAGEFADLYDLALLGLEGFCRARAGRIEIDSFQLDDSSAVLARYLFLIPSLARAPSWHPSEVRRS